MIVDKCRNLKEMYNLYNSCDNSRLPNVLSILSINSHRCFYDENDGALVGCIYLENENDKVMLSGFGRRKSMDDIVEAISYILKLNKNIDIYSRTTKRNAKLVLLRAGFEKISDELLIRKAVK